MTNSTDKSVFSPLSFSLNEDAEISRMIADEFAAYDAAEADDEEKVVAAVEEEAYKPWHLSANPAYDPDEEEYTCETCGPSYDSVSVDVSGDLAKVDIRLSVGCTGGGSANDVSIEEALIWLKDWLNLPWLREVIVPLETLQKMLTRP